MSALSFRPVRTIVLATALIGIVAGCSRGDSGSPATAPTAAAPLAPAQIIYTPPSGAPPEPFSISKSGAPAALLQNAATLLQSEGFWIERFAPERGYVAATRTVTSSAAVDCGWIVEARSPGQHQRHNAAEPVLTLSPTSANGVPTRRRMELETRVVVTAEPLGETSAQLRSVVQYVMIRTIDPPDGGREAIHFRSGGEGAFADGTVCQPRGTLERRTLANL